MHHLLSHILIFFMGYVGHLDKATGSLSYVMQEVRELEALKRGQVAALKEIIGSSKLGDTPTSAQLRAQGSVWAQHVLEAPISWIMSLVYILGTLVAHQTPLGALACAALGHPLPWGVADAPGWEVALQYFVALLDTIVYAFLPWWTTVRYNLTQAARRAGGRAGGRVGGG